MRTVACCLYPPADGPWREWFNGPTANVMYTTEWVDKLARAVRRNSSEPVRVVCITDVSPDWFVEDIDVYPFELEVHRGKWMSLTEVFRPDLGIEQALFMGLDTVICGSLDELFEYSGAIAFTRSHEKDPVFEDSLVLTDGRNVREVCNAVVSYRQNFARSIWKRYVEHPLGYANLSTAEWTKGEGSEMIFWREWCEFDYEILSDLYPGQIQNHHDIEDTTKPNDVRIVYFHGAAKPHKFDQPIITEHWT